MDETTNGGNVVDVEGAGESKLSSRLCGMEQKSRQVTV